MLNTVKVHHQLHPYIFVSYYQKGLLFKGIVLIVLAEPILIPRTLPESCSLLQ